MSGSRRRPVTGSRLSVTTHTPRGLTHTHNWPGRLFMNRKALGRGLGALLSSDSTVDLGAEPSEVEIDSIVPGPMQPRTHFDESSLESLAESIRTHGIVQPLLVRRRDSGYELIAGERRWRAAKLAGISRVPVVIR